MNVDRYMVNLFFEIKRNLPFHLQSGLKISSPTLTQDIVDVYNTTEDENIKLLIDRFFERAQIDPIGSDAKDVGKEPPDKPRRYYRGALLD
ncbi:MAG: hypothetical protein MK188_08820 [Gammaproteobacteria bacterium]|nr:hypothetical protein [Gammaproteobacteria bacterium]